MKKPTTKGGVRKVNGGICFECGVSANVLTCIKEYGDRPKKLCFILSTYHTGTCDICGEEKNLTEARDFFYPDFSLLPTTPRTKGKQIRK